MFVYFFIYFFVLILMYGYQVSIDKSSSLLCLFLSFSILFIFLAFRYNVGTDYQNYSNIIIEKVLKKKKFDEFEIGWRFLLFLIYYFNLPVHFFFVVPAFVMLILFFIIVPKHSALLSMASFLSMAYLDSFLLVRQNLAIMIVAFSIYRYYKKENFFKLFLGIVFAFFFHKSAIIFLPLIFVFQQKKVIINQKFYLVTIFLVFILFTSINIPEIVMKKVIGNTFYSVYTGMNDAKEATKIGSGLGVMLRYAIVLLCFYTPKYSIVNYNEKRIIKFENFNSIILLVLLVLYIFSTQVTIFFRGPTIITPIYVVFFYFIGMKRYPLRKLQNTLLLFLFSIMYIVTILKGGPDTASGLVPYQTIFLHMDKLLN